MATTRVGSRDSAIVYTSSWFNSDSNSPYSDAVSFTSFEDETATLAFNGTSIKVYGIIDPDRGSTPPSSSYTIDGGMAKVYSAAMTTRRQDQVQFFASPQLPSGQHTLVVRNLQIGGYLILDFFLIASVTATTQSSPTPTTLTSSTSSADAGSQTSTAILTQLGTSAVVTGSSTVPSVSTQTTVSLSAYQSQVSTTSGVGASSSGSGSSSGASSRPSTAAHKTSLGPIVAGVIGGIVLLTITNALIFFLWRRNRKMQGGGVHASPRGPASGVTPFSPPPRFNQQPLARRHSGAAFPAHLLPAQVTGKRQVTAPDDRSASSAALLETDGRREEHLHGNITPPFSTMGISNGNSNSTDVHQAYHVKLLEETPPPYQTGAPRDTERIWVELRNASER